VVALVRGRGSREAGSRPLEERLAEQAAARPAALESPSRRRRLDPWTPRRSPGLRERGRATSSRTRTFVTPRPATPRRHRRKTARGLGRPRSPRPPSGGKSMPPRRDHRLRRGARSAAAGRRPRSATPPRPSSSVPRTERRDSRAWARRPFARSPTRTRPRADRRSLPEPAARRDRRGRCRSFDAFSRPGRAPLRVHADPRDLGRPTARPSSVVTRPWAGLLIEKGASPSRRASRRARRSLRGHERAATIDVGATSRARLVETGPHAASRSSRARASSPVRRRSDRHLSRRAAPHPRSALELFGDEGRVPPRPFRSRSRSASTEELPRNRSSPLVAGRPEYRPLAGAKTKATLVDHLPRQARFLVPRRSLCASAQKGGQPRGAERLEGAAATSEAGGAPP